MAERKEPSSASASTPMRQTRSAALAYVDEIAASTAKTSTARFIFELSLPCAPSLSFLTRNGGRKQRAKHYSCRKLLRRLQLGVLDHLRPFFGFALDEIAEMRRRV